MGFKKNHSSTFRPAPNTRKQHAGTRKKEINNSLRCLRDSSYLPKWSTGHTIKIEYIAAKEATENKYVSPSGKAIELNATLVVTGCPDNNTDTAVSSICAESMHISINFHTNPAQDICKVLEILGEIKASIQGVKYLVLNVYSSQTENPMTEEEEKVETASINGYARQFVKLVPNVRYLRCNDSVSEKINMAFQREVMRLLSPRLHFVRCYSNNIESLRHLSQQLLSLQLTSQDTCAVESLRIRSDKLRGLVLNKINDDFSWKMFESKDKPGYIDFCNVERMDLDTDSYFLLKGGLGKHVYSGPTKPFPYTINAPNLLSLEIKLSPAVFSMLSNAKLPKSLGWLGIEGICSMYIRMQYVNTQELVRVLSPYKDIGDNDLEHDSIINSLMGSPDIAEMIQCVIDRPLSLKEIALLNNHLYINILHMNKPIAFSNLLVLLSHMPRIRYVEAKEIIFTKDRDGKVSISELERD